MCRLTALLVLVLSSVSAHAGGPPKARSGSDRVVGRAIARTLAALREVAPAQAARLRAALRDATGGAKAITTALSTTGGGLEVVDRRGVTWNVDSASGQVPAGHRSWIQVYSKDTVLEGKVLNGVFMPATQPEPPRR